MRFWFCLGFLLATFCLGGCSTKHPPLKPVPYVDLKRFMGDWWVIENLPTFVEENCHNALEQYKLRDDGDVDITFSCSKKGFDTPRKTYSMRGLVKNRETNAEWRVRPFWPLSFPFIVIDLDEAYSYTVIGYPSRKYVWVMAREKSIPEETLKGIHARLQEQGYDPNLFKKVPLR